MDWTMLWAKIRKLEQLSGGGSGGRIPIIDLTSTPLTADPDNVDRQIATLTAEQLATLNGVADGAATLKLSVDLGDGNAVPAYTVLVCRVEIGMDGNPLWTGALNYFFPDDGIMMDMFVHINTVTGKLTTDVRA